MQGPDTTASYRISAHALARASCISRTGIVALFAVALVACGRAQGPALHALVCVEDEAGLEVLRQTLREAANAEGLRFVDMSASRPAQLKAVGASMEYLLKPEHYFEVWGDGGSGAGFSASNLDLSSFEVSVGFGGGADDQLEAKHLGGRVLMDLPPSWHIDFIPSDRGALPTGSCPGSASRKAPPGRSLERTRGS